MSLERIQYLSSKTADELYANTGRNLARYIDGDFLDLAIQGGWSIPLTATGNLFLLEQLHLGRDRETEIENSLIVWNALSGLTPSLACENRIWARLCHIECLKYARARWLSGLSHDDIEKRARVHFFAVSHTAWRDDNALSRLWWNAYFAKLAFPDDVKLALTLILRSADIRSNIIERSWLCTRQNVLAGVLRKILREPWITETESNFRRFMKEVNLQGGGVVFEVLLDDQIDAFLDKCVGLVREKDAAHGVAVT